MRHASRQPGVHGWCPFARWVFGCVPRGASVHIAASTLERWRSRLSPCQNCPGHLGGICAPSAAQAL